MSERSDKPTPSPAEWLDLLIAKAPALRTAGVLAVELGNVRFQMTPPEMQMPAQTTDRRTGPPPADPLDDPALFGRRDGSLPGFGDPTDED